MPKKHKLKFQKNIRW